MKHSSFGDPSKQRDSTGKILTLYGPFIPLFFVDDGCTMSPNGWWREACRVHDYEYAQIRKLIVRRKRSVDAQVRQSLKKRIKADRKTADLNLKQNIRLLSQGGWLKSAFAWWVSRRYYGAVRRWGVRALKS